VEFMNLNLRLDRGEDFRPMGDCYFGQFFFQNCRSSLPTFLATYVHILTVKIMH
jgi:hypothetical protein